MEKKTAYWITFFIILAFFTGLAVGTGLQTTANAAQPTETKNYICYTWLDDDQIEIRKCYERVCTPWSQGIAGC